MLLNNCLHCRYTIQLLIFAYFLIINVLNIKTFSIWIVYYNKKINKKRMSPFSTFWKWNKTNYSKTIPNHSIRHCEANIRILLNYQHYNSVILSLQVYSLCMCGWVVQPLDTYIMAEYHMMTGWFSAVIFLWSLRCDVGAKKKQPPLRL